MAYARVLPFATYLVFLTIGSGLSWAGSSGQWSAATQELVRLWLYPAQIASVLGLLIYFWPRYEELKGFAFAGLRGTLLALGVGVLVYAAWVRMDWPWALQGGESSGYNPYETGKEVGMILAGIRLFGATIVVPVMEELFWRSFLLRYAIITRFESVPLGTFTPGSFLITVILFGVEHHQWFAGMMAGAAYTLLLYGTRRLWPSVVAHGVTNFALGIHVLVTGEWQWW